MTDNTTYRNALKLDSMLLEYRLESVLGAGGFGMTYLGWDSHLEKHVAIKEYLPGELAIRALDGSVVPVNTDSEYNYKWGLERFIQEARTLARFSHPNIVRVNRFFEANGTSYMVMDYEAGESLYQCLQRTPMPDEAALKSMLLPILDGLEAIHAAGFLHRDIKPSNVFMRANGSPVLIDFGASRLAAANSSKLLTAIVSPGYAPLEQYSGDGNQGPWTDIYALAGVMYRAVTNQNPPDAVRRLKMDAVPADLAAAQARYGERFLKAVAWGMKIDERLRPQNVAEWRELFSGRMPISALDRAAGVTAMPPRVTTAIAPAPRVMTVAAARHSSPASDAMQSGLRVGNIAPNSWKWLWRGALFCLAAISAATMVKPRSIERDLHKQAAREVRPAAVLPRQVVARFEKVESNPGGDAPRDEQVQPPPPVQQPPQVQQPLPSPETRSVSAREGVPFAVLKEFMAADRDADGYLSAWEVRGRFPAIERNLGEVDSNRDGRISLEEFAQFRKKIMVGKLPQS